MTDFDLIDLIPQERLRLFAMRFHRRAGEKFLGSYGRNLHNLRFIARNTSAEQRDENGVTVYDGTYSLTRRYYRYCAHRRKRFFFGTVWPVIVSFAVSFIVSLFVTHTVAVISTIMHL